MKFTNDYLDLWDRPASLNQEELGFFWNTVGFVRSVLGTDVEILNRDHVKELTGKSKEALGRFYTSDLGDLKKDCFITVDNYFIHECYEEKFHGAYNLNFQSLEEVICHEIAHAEQFRHCKRHSRISDEMLEKVEKAKKERMMHIVCDFETGDKSVGITVELEPGYLVDVKVSYEAWAASVMQNEDGSTVYGAYSEVNYPDYKYDEKAVVQLVKTAIMNDRQVGKFNMELKDILAHDEEYRYRLLDRMKSDCKYFLGYGNHNTKDLWANSVDEQIAYMKAIWESFPEDKKPEWLSMDDILNFERQMNGMTAAIEEKGGVLNVRGTASIQIDNEQMAIDEIELVLSSKGMTDISVEVASVEEIDDLEEDWFPDKNYHLEFSGKIAHDKLPDLKIATYVEEVKTDLPSLESLIGGAAKQKSALSNSAVRRDVKISVERE